MREAWIDDRLDDLDRKVDEGFRRIDVRLNQVEARFDSAQAHMEKRFDTMQAHLDRRLEGQGNRFERIDIRLDGLQRSLVLTQATFVAGLLGLLATQL